MQILSLVNPLERSGGAMAAFAYEDLRNGSGNFAEFLDSSANTNSPANALNTSGSILTAMYESRPTTDTRLSGESSGGGEKGRIQVTQEDFAALRPELEQHGFSEADIRELETRVQNSGGITWAELTVAIKEKAQSAQTAVELSGEDKRNLQSLFGKLGFSQSESEKLLGQFERGETQAAWAMIQGRLTNMAKEGGLNVAPAEGRALAKALGLTDEAQARVADIFGRLQSGELSDQATRSSLLMIKSEVKEHLSAKDKAVGDLVGAVNKLFAQALKRASAGSLADANEDDVARKAIVAESLAARSGRKTGSTDDVAGKPAEGLTVRDQVNPELKQGVGELLDAARAVADRPRTGRETADAKSGQGKTASGESQAAAAGNKTQLAASGKGAGAGNGSDAGKGGAFGADRDWAGVIGRIARDRDATAVSGAKNDFSSRLDAGATLTPTATSTAKADAAQLGTLDAQTRSRVLEQVQSGILKNLGQGGKTLTMELTPENLGRLNIMLTVKDKEVRATITAESEEAAKLLGDQLGKVKESLEQQGLKVSKLEVRTGLDQQSGQAWQGAGEHNQARERREAVQTMSTLRQLSVMAAETANQGSEPRTALSAASEGLDIIA